MTIKIHITLTQPADADILQAIQRYTDLGLVPQVALKTLIRAGLVKSQIVDALIAGLADSKLSTQDDIDAYNAEIEAYNASVDQHNDLVDSEGVTS